MSSRRVLAALLVLVLVLAACSSDDDGAATTSGAGTSTTGGEDTTEAPPDTPPASECAVGPAGDDGTVVIETVESLAADLGLSTVLYRVTRGDEVLASGTLGDTLTGVPATTDLRFRTGNVAFAYMGTLLLLFEEEGLATLDDPVSQWLPDLDAPDADGVTLRMLANNTSGWPDYVGDPDFLAAADEDPFAQFTDQDLLEIGFASPSHYPPGEGWSYSHTNYVVLGQALAAIGGAPLEELLLERVIEPMGLSETTPALTPELPDPPMHSYSTERGVFEQTTFWNPSWQTARGGVVASTICDLATSAAAVGRGDLLSTASYEAMIAPDTVGIESPEDCDACRPMTDDRYFGLGILVFDGWVAQTPLFGGSGTVHAYLPDADVAVALVAVSGAETEPNVNHALAIWKAIATELTPENVPPV